jgi:putative hemolysin
VVSAVIDDKWDEVNQQMLIDDTQDTDTNNNASKNTGNLVMIRYTPKQCETAPWDAWLADSTIRFIKAPTDEQVITMFYSQENNTVILHELKKTVFSEITCMACGACDKGYRFETAIDPKDEQKMIATGWIASSAQDDTSDSTGAQMANPASTYCVKQGYNNVIKTNVDGSQTGYCDFGNGKECEEWAYYRRECGP